MGAVLYLGLKDPKRDPNLENYPYDYQRLGPLGANMHLSPKP